MNTRLRAIQIKGQRKAFCSQGIPKSSHVKKETADIDILITFKIGHSKMQAIKITCHTQPIEITSRLATIMSN